MSGLDFITDNTAAGFAYLCLYTEGSNKALEKYISVDQALV